MQKNQRKLHIIFKGFYPGPHTMNLTCRKILIDRLIIRVYCNIKCGYNKQSDKTHNKKEEKVSISMSVDNDKTDM